MTLLEKDNSDMMYLLSSTCHFCPFRKLEKIISLDSCKCLWSCQVENNDEIWEVRVSDVWGKWAIGWRKSPKWVILKEAFWDCKAHTQWTSLEYNLGSVLFTLSFNDTDKLVSIHSWNLPSLCTWWAVLKRESWRKNSWPWGQ